MLMIKTIASSSDYTVSLVRNMSLPKAGQSSELDIQVFHCRNVTNLCSSRVGSIPCVPA